VCPVTYNNRIRVLERLLSVYERFTKHRRTRIAVTLVSFARSLTVRPKNVRKGSGRARTTLTPIRLKMGV
jgi:hypothetical protein